jgi:site-specific DNA-methyltransferase (adenine-specific)
MNPIHFSSKSDDWETRWPFFKAIEREFGPFTCDVCATQANTKVGHFFSPEVDGLSQEWTGTVLMNPPYGVELKKWMKKASEEAQKGATVIALIPARTDTKWWFDYVAHKAAEIRFLKGRLRFGNAEHSAPFPSAVVIYRPGERRRPKVSFVDYEEIQPGCLAS